MRLAIDILRVLLGIVCVLAGLFVAGCLADYWLEYTTHGHIWFGVIDVGVGLWLAGIPVIFAIGCLIGSPALACFWWESDKDGAR